MTDSSSNVSASSSASEQETSEPQSLTQPPPPSEASLRRGAARKFWNRTNIIVGVVLGVIGAITGVISVIPILTRDASNFSHLEISAEPVSSGASVWAVPADALRSGFPQGMPCGPEQLEWLQTHATQIQQSFMLNARNSASEGAMLALTEFRSTADPVANEARGEVSVRLVCDPSGTLPETVYYAQLMADDPSQVAAHVKLEAGTAATASPKMPVAFNLAPGESGKIPLELFSRNPATGSVQVTVLSRDESRTIEIEGSAFEMPALLFAGEMYLVTVADGLACVRSDAGALVPCTLDELNSELEGIGQ